MLPIEDVKNDIATKLMGWTIVESPIGLIINEENEEDRLYSEWCPNIGGEDLAEVLSKLSDDQRGWLYNGLPEDAYLECDWDNEDLMDVLIWFQNPDNAETILRAVWKAIKQKVKDE